MSGLLEALDSAASVMLQDPVQVRGLSYLAASFPHFRDELFIERADSARVAAEVNNVVVSQNF